MAICGNVVGFMKYVLLPQNEAIFEAKKICDLLSIEYTRKKISRGIKTGNKEETKGHKRKQRKTMENNGNKGKQRKQYKET